MTPKIYISKANLSSDLQKRFCCSVYPIFHFSKAFQTRFPYNLPPPTGSSFNMPCLSEQLYIPFSLVSQNQGSQL